MSVEDHRDAKVATEAVVFMFTAINDDLKIPIAYYFTAPTKGDTRYAIAQEVARAVLQCGVHLTSITFDGHRSNPGACTELGANLDIYDDNYDPSFQIDNARIRIILDFSHMMKLFRNSLGN